MMRICFLVCVSGLITAYIICCQVNVTLDTILGIEDILMTWFLIILALLDVALLSVCCLIHCKHLRLSDVNKNTLTYLLMTDILKILLLFSSAWWWRGVVVNALVAINEVTLRRARLELGWVTVCGRVNHLGM